jgi:hypothetical membrane protein
MTDTRRVAVAGWAWTAVAVYFVANVSTAARWIDPLYAPTRNMISDLGATQCEILHERAVCSPWHLLVDTAWVITGLLIIAGAWGFAAIAPAGARGRWGTILLACSGLGLIIIATNPENLRPAVHVIGAMVAAIGGVGGMFVLGWALWREHRWRLLAGAGMVVAPLSVIGNAAGKIFNSHVSGLMERIGQFPYLLWMIACGVTVLATYGVRAQTVR